MFEQSVLKQLEMDVGVDTLRQLFEVFAAESTKLKQQIITCDTIDETAIRASHSLKSCACSYGAQTLAELAAHLEQAAREGKPSFFEIRGKLDAIHTKTMLEIHFNNTILMQLRARVPLLTVQIQLSSI